MRVRKTHLTPGDDFAMVPQRGIMLTPAGIEKIKKALPPDTVEEAQKNEVPPAPAAVAVEGVEGVEVVIVRRSANVRACLCRIVGRPEPHRAFVVPSHRLKASTLNVGMVLTGCRFVNPELLTYDGPVPARLGMPMPERKKEGGAA